MLAVLLLAALLDAGGREVKWTTKHQWGRAAPAEESEGREKDPVYRPLIWAPA